MRCPGEPWVREWREKNSPQRRLWRSGQGSKREMRGSTKEKTKFYRGDQPRHVYLEDIQSLEVRCLGQCDSRQYNFRKDGRNRNKMTSGWNREFDPYPFNTHGSGEWIGKHRGGCQIMDGSDLSAWMSWDKDQTPWSNWEKWEWGLQSVGGIHHHFRHRNRRKGMNF